MTTIEKLDLVGGKLFTEKQIHVLKTLFTPPRYGSTLCDFARDAGLSNNSFSSVVTSLNKKVESLVERHVSPFGRDYGVWYRLDKDVLNRFLEESFIKDDSH